LRKSYLTIVLILALLAAFASTAAFSGPKEKSGSPDVHWVRATVDPRDEEIFSFEPEIVEENVAPKTGRGDRR